MKKIVTKVIQEEVVTPAVVETEVIEDSNEGLVSLIGKRVILMCSAYFYSGVLVGVNQSCVRLDDAYLVFDTGQSWSAKTFASSQKIGDAHYVMMGHIESFRQDSRK